MNEKDYQHLNQRGLIITNRYIDERGIEITEINATSLGKTVLELDTLARNLDR